MFRAPTPHFFHGLLILTIVHINVLCTLVIRKLQFDKAGEGKMLCGLALLFLISFYEGIEIASDCL